MAEAPSLIKFRAEYAKTGRAGCKGCPKNIAQDSLKIIRSFPSPFYDGEMAHAFHMACFFNKQLKMRPTTKKLLRVEDLEGYSDLRWDDQDSFKRGLAKNVADLEARGTEAKPAKSKKKKKEEEPAAGKTDDAPAPVSKKRKKTVKEEDEDEPPKKKPKKAVKKEEEDAEPAERKRPKPRGKPKAEAETETPAATPVKAEAVKAEEEEDVGKGKSAKKRKRSEKGDSVKRTASEKSVEVVEDSPPTKKTKRKSKGDDEEGVVEVVAPPPKRSRKKAQAEEAPGENAEVKRLVEMGFDAAAAETALEARHGDSEKAIAFLLGTDAGGGAGADVAPAVTTTTTTTTTPSETPTRSMTRAGSAAVRRASKAAAVAEEASRTAETAETPTAVTRRASRSSSRLAAASPVPAEESPTTSKAALLSRARRRSSAASTLEAAAAAAASAAADEAPETPTAGTKGRRGGKKKAARTSSGGEGMSEAERQSRLLWEMKDALTKNCKKGVLTGILEANGMSGKGGPSELVSRIADAALYGKPKPCPVCNGATIFFNDKRYRCAGWLSEWSRCSFVARTVDTEQLVVPDDLDEENPAVELLRERAAETPLTRAAAAEDPADAATESVGMFSGKRPVASADTFAAEKVEMRKYSMKGRAAVDPGSGMAEKGHILQEHGVTYNAMLVLTDIATGRNSFYTLQVIVSDENASSAYLYKAYGRIGTRMGTKNLSSRMGVDGAKKGFTEKWEDLTGNAWDERDSFEKKPGKYYPVALSYGREDGDEPKEATQEDGEEAGDAEGVASTLDPRLQKMMTLLFDVKAMETTMVAMAIDVNKMPLGQLSKEQIKKGYQVLTDIETTLSGETGLRRDALLVDLSNRFYTIIPHTFGAHGIPIIDTVEKLKAKIEVMQTLLDLEVSQSVVRGAGGASKLMHPLDAEYAQLKCNLSPLERDTDEWKVIEHFVKNTHAPTHTRYTLTIEDVIAVDRHGETARFAPFADLHNRMLLWHGSRMSNYAGILRQGLRIAPPEAPVTGYMFGKGVYFADMCSKSANYCWATKEQPIGFLLLSEVALGTPHTVRRAETFEKAPVGTHSIFGEGATVPNPKYIYTTEEGVQVPVGKPVPANLEGEPTDLLYNEFVVYDEAQARMRYVVAVRFDFVE